MAYQWGVDSAAKVTKDLYNCVLHNFGRPQVWGRYLTTVPNAAEGLTLDEVELLHASGTKVLPIYNNFRAAVGYDNGVLVARNTIFQARRLGIPKDTVLFANVERFFDVDDDWIRGYVNTFIPSGYRAGIYHDPIEGLFNQAYCQAVQNDNKVSRQLILWSAEPDPGATKRREAPNFNPNKPNCSANVWGWQYGRDALECPIDTNLFDNRLYRLLW